jgi:RHS repeat-associated protein
MKDPLERVSTYGYDSLGNLSSVTQMAGTSSAHTSTYTYDPSYSQLTSVKDPLEKTTTYGYDSLGELTSITDPLKHTNTLAYANGGGLPTSSTDALKNTTTYGYNSYGDLIATHDPLGNTTSRFLDAGGRLVAGTDALGDTTRYGYDPLNDLTSVTDPAGGVTAFEYDPNGNLASLTDANKNKTTYSYDYANRLTSDTDALGKSDSYTYGPNGNLTSWTDRKGQLTSYTYDALNRRNFVGYGTTGTPPLLAYQSTINYTYDPGNRLTEAVDSTGGTFKEGWDNFDELTKESGPDGSIGYGYDADGRRSSATVSGQPQLSYGYDNASRLTSIGPEGGSPLVALSYYDNNLPQSVKLPDGIEEQYSFNPGAQLTGINYVSASSTLGGLNYAYDPAGNRTAVWGSYARLRLPKAFSSATFNADNELTARGSHTSSYDADGNLTGEGTPTDEDGAGSYAWNARSQLTSALVKTKLSSFTYDPFGRRKQEVATNGTTTNFLYDGQNVAQELLGSTPQVNYTLGLGLDQRYARTDSTGTQSFVTDALGSTIGLANSAGSVQTSYTYDPFGQPTSSGTTSSNQFQFTGLQNDGNALQYNRARYYSPSTERFISQDPLGASGSGRNVYAYSSNNPVNQTDPTGLISLRDVPIFGCVADVLSGRKSVGGAVGCGFAVAGTLATGYGAARLVVGALADSGLGAELVADGAGTTASDTVVLGHYPEYLQTAEQIGGRTFNVPQTVWDVMSPEEQWAANQRFLDRAIARGSEVQLATPAAAAREGSFYERELQYLQSRGYTVGSGGTTMIPPGG